MTFRRWKYCCYGLLVATICLGSAGCSGNEAPGTATTSPTVAAPAAASPTPATPVAAQSPAATSEVAASATPTPAAPAPAPPEKAEANPAAPPPTPRPPRVYTLPAGSRISVYTAPTLSTKTSKTGDSFAASLAESLSVDGHVIAKKGANVEGVVVSSDPGGRVKGVASMSVALRRLTLADGRAVSISTSSYGAQARSTKKKDAAKIGIGAGVGAAIGAIAGGGKGAAIGAGVGGGAGTGMVLATRGEPATIPSESLLSFTLRSPIQVTQP
jgi:hypothetical protein